MFVVIGLMFAGIALGYLFRKRLILRRFSNLMGWTVYLLLFSLGISVGNNREIICNLSALGGQALWLAFAGTLGSVWGAWIVYRNFFKNKS
ncbi:LysO family transporter [Tannerella forsythia]|uniref:LysO family transporter n=1 Tax=Tannerella forsythia TaxID=28112 RepID=UPI0028EA3935|nr:LysO family transporter [Tannerella forsythia]